MPARTIQKRRTTTVQWGGQTRDALGAPSTLSDDGPVRFVPQRERVAAVEWCYCHLCKYEVLCEPADDDGSGPIRFVPQQEEEWCYCHLCRYEVLCGPADDDGSGPVRFVPQ